MRPVTASPIASGVFSRIPAAPLTDSVSIKDSRKKVFTFEILVYNDYIPHKKENEVETEQKNKKEARLEAKRLKAQQKAAKAEAKKQKQEARRQKRSKGRKIFTFFFILFLLAGGAAAVFFIGWVHPPLNGNQYAVIFSKTGGYRETPLRADEFLWMPERLLPTNTTVLIYSVEPRSCSVDVEGKLPSGDIYSMLIEGAPSFAFRFSCRLTCRLNPERLIDLAREGVLPEQTEALIAGFEKDFQPMIIDLIQKKSTDSEFVSLIGSDFSKLQEVLTEEIEARNPNIDVTRLIVNSISLPDIRLYEEARNLYFRTIQNVPPERLQRLQKEVTEGTAQLMKYQSLEELARLLEKYPILMEYAKINPTLEMPRNGEQ